MKKNYFYLSLVVIATTYQAFSLIFYPELAPDWLIRFFGFLFVLYAIGYIFDIKKLYLQNEINRLDKENSDLLEAEKYIISDWHEKNSNRELDKQILELLKAIDDANPVDKLCGIKFYQDGSGVIYNGDIESHRFDTRDQAIDYLKNHPVFKI